MRASECMYVCECVRLRVTWEWMHLCTQLSILISSTDRSMTESLFRTLTCSPSMAIVNLLFKPFSSFVLFRLYQERGGNYADLSIPGLPDFGLGGVPAQSKLGGHP